MQERRSRRAAEGLSLANLILQAARADPDRHRAVITHVHERQKPEREKEERERRERELSKTVG